MVCKLCFAFMPCMCEKGLSACTVAITQSTVSAKFSILCSFRDKCQEKFCIGMDNAVWAERFRLILRRCQTQPVHLFLDQMDQSVLTGTLIYIKGLNSRWLALIQIVGFWLISMNGFFRSELVIYRLTNICTYLDLTSSLPSYSSNSSLWYKWSIYF